MLTGADGRHADATRITRVLGVRRWSRAGAVDAVGAPNTAFGAGRHGRWLARRAPGRPQTDHIRARNHGHHRSTLTVGNPRWPARTRHHRHPRTPPDRPKIAFGTLRSRVRIPPSRPEKCLPPTTSSSSPPRAGPGDPRRRRPSSTLPLPRRHPGRTASVEAAPPCVYTGNTRIYYRCDQATDRRR